MIHVWGGAGRVIFIAKADITRADGRVIRILGLSPNSPNKHTQTTGPGIVDGCVSAEGNVRFYS